MAHKVVLTWNAPTTGDAPASYDVQRGTAATGPWTTLANVPATQTTYEDDAVTAGEALFYQVLSKNAAGESGPSNEVAVNVPLSLPGSPISLVAVAS